MKKFDFGRPGSPISIYPLIKFVLGWNAIGIAFYQFAWKPKVKQATEEAGYDWDKLSSAQKYTQFIGKDLAEVKVKQYSLFGEVQETVATKRGATINDSKQAAASANNPSLAYCATKGKLDKEMDIRLASSKKLDAVEESVDATEIKGESKS